MTASEPKVERLDRDLAAAQADALAAEAVTVDGAAEALAWQVTDVEAALRAGRLIAFDHRGRRRLPMWQLSAAEPPRPLPCIPALARSFGGDAIALTAWVRTPNPHLHGHTPSEALLAGEDERVSDALAALGAAAF